jgi:hypothetical protein
VTAALWWGVAMVVRKAEEDGCAGDTERGAPSHYNLLGLL